MLTDIASREKLLLQQMEELAKTGSWELNLDTVALYWSDGVFKILEYEPQAFEVTFKKGLEVIHPDDRNDALQAMQEAIKTGKPYSIEKRFVTKNGVVKHIRSIGKILWNEAKQPIKMVGVFQDITERVLAENVLKETNQRLEMVMQAGYESIWDYNPLTDELYMGEGFTRNFGVPVYDVTKNSAYINSLFHPDDRESVLSDFSHKVFHTNETNWIKEFRFKKANGEYAFVRGRAIIKRNEAGVVMRVVGAIQDMTVEHYYRELDRIEKEAMTLSFREDITVPDLLSKFLLQLESVFPNLKTSVLRVLDGKLFNMASPSLPEAYIATINGMAIGDESGVHTNAATAQNKTTATHQLTEARWANFTGLAQQFGLGSCWAQPVLNAKGKPIANLLVYFDSNKGVTNIEAQAISRAQRLISVLLVKFEYLEHIQKTNERYELMNKATNDAMYDWDVQNDVFYWGDSFYRIFGHAKKEQPFRLIDWAILMHPYDAEMHQAGWESFLKDTAQERWQKEFRFRRADGSFAFVEENGYLIRNQQGHPVRMIGVLRDISDSKITALQQQVQQQVAQCFKMHLSLQEQMHQVLQYLAEFGSFKTAEIWLLNYNREFLQLAATYSADEKAALLYTYYSATNQFKLSEGIPGKVWQTRQWQVLENTDENDAFVRWEAAKQAGLKAALALPLFDFDQVVGVLLFTSNTSIRKDDVKIQLYRPLSDFLGAEIVRRQQEAQLALFFETATDILAIAAPNGRFAKVNPAFCALLGYTEEELTTQPFSEFVHPDDLKATQQDFSETILGNQKSNNFINRFRTKSGNYRWISWNSSQPFGEDGLVFAYGRDITEMRHLEELLQLATQLSKVGAWELDPIHHKLQWSEITKAIHEVPPDYQPELETAIGFYRAAYQAVVREKISETMANGVPFDIQAPIITVKGNERWVRVIGQAEMYNGQCIRMYGSIQDIHDRKMIELRLKNISDNVPGVIFQYHLKPDGTDQLLYVSEGAHRIWRVAPEECMTDIQTIWKGIIAGGDIEAVKQSIIQSATHLTPWHATWKYVLSDGSLRYHEGFGNPHKPTDGSIVWDSIVMDITEKHNLQELAKRTARMAKIGSWELDLVDDINDSMFWSVITREIFEVPDDYIPSASKCIEFFKGDSRIKLEEIIQQLIQHGTDFDEEFLITTYANQSKWVRCIGRSEWAMGKCVKIFGSIQDIHDKKTAEQLLQQHVQELAISNRELEQFAYIASHDLQEPLRMVTSFLSLLEQKYKDQLDDQAKQYIGFAVDGAKRMRQLVLDVLELSRVGKTRTKKEQIDMDALMEEVCTMQKAQIEESGAIVQIHELPVLFNYRSSLLQVFNNLLNNALKYRKKDGIPVINITATKENKGWLFAVADNGIGIEQEYLEQIFVIFQRLHTKENYSGTGIGLAIVKKIVEHLGGKIWATSTPGIGSTFYCWLPEAESLSDSIF
ncbi:PAS domain-containing protein [Hydrotalea flava]|uniref:PAS domain-containing protein n=1 Tax=Hydrotalea flava TaxID=714549 RepID=UPI000A51543E|nr:PAS domain-containing protein [Hydrotalea flava]